MIHTQCVQGSHEFTCVHAGIANMVWALTTQYSSNNMLRVNLQVFACTIRVGVNILQKWLSLLWNYDFQAVWKEYDLFPYFVHKLCPNIR